MNDRTAVSTKAGKRLLAVMGSIPPDGRKGLAWFVEQIETEAREGYVPASLSPEWHAELEVAAAEAVAAEKERLRAAVKGLRVRPFAVAESGWQVGFRQSRNETVDAVLAILDAPTETTP